MNRYLYKFIYLLPKHRLELFDKLITPILNHGCEIWGFIQANAVERAHLQFCKRLLAVKNRRILSMKNLVEQIFLPDFTFDYKILAKTYLCR